MTAVSALAGILLVLAVLIEAFEALVLPRRITRKLRFARLYYRYGWKAWAASADLIFRPGPRRETTLSIFGPLSLLVLFALWAGGLIVGFGLLHHAAAPRAGGLGDSLYFSGVTFSTVGYGDLSPVGSASRALSVIEAATGFGFFAVVIAYLPVLYQAFGRREALIALLDARAGSPPSGGRLLLRQPPGEGGAILERFLEESEKWAAEVLEAQLSFPVLGYYRSQHDNQSWLAAMICALDTSALVLTVADGADRRQARLTFAMCRHALVDLSLILGRTLGELAQDRLPEARLKRLFGELRKVGVVVRDDPATVAKLAELRSLYEPFAMALGRYFRLTVPDVWPDSDRPDNWQTSAWMRRADPLTALGADPKDEHFG